MAIGPVPPLAGNSNAPYLSDSFGVAAGLGLIFASALTSTQTTFAAEYQHGTHAAAIYDSQFKGAIFPSVKGGTPNSAVRTLYGAPQAYDFTLQPWLVSPNDKESVSVAGEYTFGTHQNQLYNSQIQSQVWSALRTPPGIADLTPFPLLFAPPQELKTDLTIQGWSSIPSVTQGLLFTVITAGPQAADLTQQAFFQNAPIKNIQANWNPTTLIGVWQADSTQLALLFIRTPQSSSPKPIIAQIVAQSPDPRVQLPAQIFPALAYRTVNYNPPTQFVVPQQAYNDIPQPDFRYPIVGQLPIFVPLTGTSFAFATGTVTPVIQQLTGIYDYFSLAQALQDFSHRSDIGNFQDYYIQQAETRIYRDMFAQNMGNGVKWLEQPFNATITNQTAAVPANYLALKAMQLNFGNVVSTILYKDPQWIYSNYVQRQPSSAPQYVARDGNNFVFGPAPDTAYLITGTYYGYSTPLSATSPLSWMTTTCPDLLLASCMLELQPFLKDPKAMQSWQSIYDMKMTALVNLDQAERMSAGTMSVEPE